jgi:hypothetical protein
MRQIQEQTFRRLKALAAALAEGQPPSDPSFLQALGLTRECDLDDIQAAYRKLSMTLHPDRGGDAEAFIRMQGNYEAAL